MLTKDDVLSLRDLALAHLPDTRALAQKAYVELKSSRAALQVVAWAPPLLMYGPNSTVVERLAGRLLHVVGQHPETHVEVLNDEVEGDDFPGALVEIMLDDARRDRLFIEELLVTTARELCSRSGAALPPWISTYAMMSSRAPDSHTQGKSKLPKLRLQEREILKWLIDNGHDSKNLPKRQNGHATVKSIAKTALGGNGPFEMPSTFDKAWVRLRSDGEIRELE